MNEGKVYVMLTGWRQSRCNLPMGDDVTPSYDDTRGRGMKTSMFHSFSFSHSLDVTMRCVNSYGIQLYFVLRKLLKK